MKRKANKRATNPMAATWTKAAKIKRAFKAGRRRETDVTLGAESAVIECRRVVLEIRKAMLDAGMFTAAEDLQAGLVLVSPIAADVQTVRIVQLPRDISGLPAMYEVVAGFVESSEAMLPLGLAIRLVDREAQDEASVWVQPTWLAGTRATLATREAVRIFEISAGESTVATF